MSGRRPKLPTADELALWHNVVRDAAPLVSKNRKTPPPKKVPAAAPVAPAPAPAPRAMEAAPAIKVPAERLAELLRAVPVAEKARVNVQLAPSPLGRVAGVDKRTDEKVRKGRMGIDARVDLHGMTQSEAHDALIGFIRRSHAAGRRMVLVITGKGQMPRGEGVLRLSVPRWLREAEVGRLVLSVHQAQPQHGGGGAYYVLLKRRREG
ncbi:Smr/MutS family protein [Niveispirillum sp. KHB5.9]|uniref:Smr/MutS family protein n=1 Tax=Niveispirillum sp. KHB5.9 TaxID=3400269 RepID=UPI003A8903F0